MWPCRNTISSEHNQQRSFNFLHEHGSHHQEQPDATVNDPQSQSVVPSQQEQLAALQAQMENLRLEKATLEERNAQLLTRTAKLEKDLQV